MSDDAFYERDRDRTRHVQIDCLPCPTLAVARTRGIATARVVRRIVLILALRGEIQALKLRHVSTTTVKLTDGETGAIVDGPKPIECRK